MRALLYLVCLIALGASAAAITCSPGFYLWIREGIEHCRLCEAGCACAGGVSECVGCSGGFFSPVPGSSVCSVCPPGTTTDFVSNVGCDPDNYITPCENRFGPLGLTVCRPDPPPSTLVFAMPSGAVPAQNTLVPVQMSY